MSNLSIPKGKKVKKPNREPDLTSKRGVDYYFGPDWVRNLNGTIGRIIPLKNGSNGVELYMLSKDGNKSYIHGSIQQEFLKWYKDQELDAILLGRDEDEILISDWLYE